MKKASLLLMTMLLIPFYSCEKDDEIEAINDNGLAEKTVQITDSDWRNNIINVDNTTFTFKFKKNVLNNYSINKGDIILGTEDGGYLRKVKNMSTIGDEITIETEFAAITEAFEELHEQATASIVPNVESQEFWLEDGVVMNSTKSTSANLMNFSINTVLYDLDGNSSTTTDQVRISGSYELDADFHIDWDIEEFELKNLILQYDINQTKVIDGYLGISGIKYYPEPQKLATIPCGTIPAGPVIIEPVINLYAGFEMDLSAPLRMRLEQDYFNSTIITYDNGNWDTEKTVTENENFEKPSISGVLKAKLYLKPELKFKVYRTVSPYIDAELYGAADVELDSDLLKWKTSVGFDMNAGVSMKIWNHTLFNFNTNLFNWEHIIAQGEESENFNLKNGLISYYKLDETNGTILEDSHSFNNGTNKGASINQAGKIGKSISFNKIINEVIETSDETLLRGTSGIISGSFWIKTSDMSDWGGYIMSKGNSYVDERAYGWTVSIFKGKVSIAVLDNAHSGEVNVERTTSSKNINNGEWHHVCFQLGASGQKIYIDGFLDIENTSNTMVSGYGSSTKKPFAIGGVYRVTHSRWDHGINGSIDEIALWTRALTTNEVKKLYNNSNGLSYPF